MPAPVKHALVTGTTSGIGEALTRALLADGWAVTGLARRPGVVADPAYTHHQVDLAAIGELTDFAAAELAPQLAAADRVALVNNAALIGALCRLEEFSAAHLQRLLTVNTAAPIWLMGLCLRTVARGTPLRIANISSGAATQGLPGLGDYCASKAGLRLAGLSLAAELEQADERDAAVLSYEPGVVATEMQVQARAADPAEFPSHATFTGFAESGALAGAEEVVGEIVQFLNETDPPRFTEKRYGSA